MIIYNDKKTGHHNEWPSVHILLCLTSYATCFMEGQSYKLLVTVNIFTSIHQTGDSSASH